MVEVDELANMPRLRVWKEFAPPMYPGRSAKQNRSEDRVSLMAERYERGLDLWTGEKRSFEIVSDD